VKPISATEHTPTLRGVVANFSLVVSSNAGYRFSITAIIIFLIKKEVLKEQKKISQFKALLHA
jgi:hypothetical protein